MTAFYNEFEPFAAQWLRELIKAGAIADGEVCGKDMWDVVPADLMGFNQVHLCAGIGGWSAALRLAGWPDDRPVWTVSLPCQPFSAAGKGGGLADERGQLADAFFWLAGVCRPDFIFGEQVEAAIKHDWLDVMASSLESIGYTVGAVGFPASIVGAFHLRQRLYWVAACKTRIQNKIEDNQNRKGKNDYRRRGKVILADATDTDRWTGERGTETGTWTDGERRRGSSGGGPACGVADAEHYGGWTDKQGWQAQGRKTDGRGCSTGVVGDSESGYWRIPIRQEWKQVAESGRTGAVNFWADAEWIPCRDGKARPTKPGLFPLAHGVRNRVGTLRGAGNAIVPQAAAEFIKAFIEK